MISLVDTHCHIHFDDLGLDPDMAIKNAKEVGVDRLMLVGCSLEDCEAGVKFVKTRADCFMSIGLHPHEGAKYADDEKALKQFSALVTEPKVVAIGETGLDYYYENSPKDQQKKLFRFQLELALEHNLPLIFHVREAFDDFFEILDEYKGIRGVVHSFSSHEAELKGVLKRGLYVGLNGIMTFTRDEAQLAAAKAVPLDKLVLETDAPFLTPKPFRGTICEPKHVRVTAEFLANLRGESLEKLSEATTANAQKLFLIK